MIHHRGKRADKRNHLQENKDVGLIEKVFKAAIIHIFKEPMKPCLKNFGSLYMTITYQANTNTKN